MSAGVKVVPIGSASMKGNKDQTRVKLARLPAAVHLVQDKSKISLGKALNQVFDNADDALFELADKADNNHDQNLFFESMREVRLRRRVMESAFLESLDQAFVQLTSNQAPTDDDEYEPSIENLQLVQNDELEELVAIDSMVSKAARNSGEILQHLSLRLDSLVALKVYQKNNPVGPDVVCNAFADTAKLLDADIKAKLVLFKLFERYVVTQLASIYESLNTVLIEQGILPSLTQERIKRQPSRPANTQYHGQQSTIPDDGQGEVLGAPSAGVSSGGFIADGSTNQNAVGGNLGNTGSASSGSAPIYQQGHPASAQSSSGAGVTAGGAQAAGHPAGAGQIAVGEIMGALSQIQERQVSSEDLIHSPVTLESARVDLGQAIVSALLSQTPQGGQHSKIGGTEKDVINLVKVLFEFILDDRNLAEPMKALIGRLQIPVLKVALLDNSFFSKSGHPARRLLNEMATAALGWSDEGKTQADLVKDSLYQKIASVVHTLLSELETNANVFSELLADFVSFIEKERKRARIIEQRTIDAESGKAQAEAARKYVADQLDALVGAASLPEPVSKIFDVAWSNVLFLVFLKDGTGNEKWTNALETAKDLVWSVTAPINSESRGQLMQLLPNLLKRLRSGLESISYNPYEMTQLLGQLEKIHLERLRAPATVANESAVESSSKIELTSGNVALAETAKVRAETQSSSADKETKTAGKSGSQGKIAKPIGEGKRPTVKEIEPPQMGVVTTAKKEQDKIAEKVTFKGKTKGGVQLQVVASNPASPESNGSVKAVSSRLKALQKDTTSPEDELTAAIKQAAKTSAKQSKGTKQEAGTGNLTPEQQYTQQVAKLTQGSWFEMYQDGDQKFRCRLAAIIKATGKYIFVNRGGQKVAEETADGLALVLQQGKMKALDDGMLFDRALESVIGDLRRSRKT